MYVLSISYAVCPHCVGLLLFYSTVQQQEQDPTNLYISNLPLSMDEQELENMLKHFGQVISTRILRDSSGHSRGVGFARSDPCLPGMLHLKHAAYVMQTLSQLQSYKIFPIQKSLQKKHWPHSSCVFSDKWGGPVELVKTNICWMTLHLFNSSDSACLRLPDVWLKDLMGRSWFIEKKITFLCQADALWSLCAQKSHVEAMACVHVGCVSS